MDDEAAEESPKAHEPSEPAGLPEDSKTSRRAGRGCLKDIFVGILTGLISGIVVAFYLTPTGQAAVTAVRDGVRDQAEPTCSNPQWLLQVPDNSIFASSYYFQKDNIPSYGVAHTPGLTVDGNLRTAWLQFWPSPTTKSARDNSDYIEWTFSNRYDIRLICIIDGWTEDNTTYEDTLPIGTATTYTSNSNIPAPHIGNPVVSRQCSRSRQSFSDYLHRKGLEYTFEWQPIPFRCLTNNVVLHIDGVSARSVLFRNGELADSQLGSYRAPLAGLSEIRFYYCPSALCFLPTH
jgi:hypothetical protein